MLLRSLLHPPGAGQITGDAALRHAAEERERRIARKLADARWLVAQMEQERGDPERGGDE